MIVVAAHAAYQLEPAGVRAAPASVEARRPPISAPANGVHFRAAEASAATLHPQNRAASEDCCGFPCCEFPLLLSGRL
jgi:hypothetical protein